MPSYAPKLLRATTAAGAVLLPLFVWGPRRSAPGLVIHETSAYLGAASVILLPILVEFLMRRIVARPQQAGSEDVVAAADAVRVSSIHAVTAAGLCVTMLLLATFATAVGFISSVGFLRWALLTTRAAVFLLAVALWFKLGPTANGRFGAIPTRREHRHDPQGRPGIPDPSLRADSLPVDHHDRSRRCVRWSPPPSIRQLASDLGLAGGTVARAYRELEAEGAIETRGRHGTFVSNGTVKLKKADSSGRLADAAHSFAVQVRQLGVDPEVALARARKALEEFAT